MSYIVFLFVAIILYFLFYGLFPALLAGTKEPPKPVGAAVMVEGVFGILVIVPIWFIDNSKILVIFFLLLSFFWICVAISLYKGSRIGRTICLILSAIRCLTIIGVPFSLFSLYKLFFTQESKDFFASKARNDKSIY